jgi:hypothetical protein
MLSVCVDCLVITVSNEQFTDNAVFRRRCRIAEAAVPSWLEEKVDVPQVKTEAGTENAAVEVIEIVSSDKEERGRGGFFGHRKQVISSCVSFKHSSWYGGAYRDKCDGIRD